MTPGRMNSNNDQCSAGKAILVTGGYDHSIKIWQAHTGVCHTTRHYVDSQVNSLAIAPDRTKFAAAGFQNVRFYDLISNNPNPIVSYDGITKNITCVGFQEEGKWMFTSGEDGHARIWDLRNKDTKFFCDFDGKVPINSAALHPRQTEIFLGDDNGTINVWNLRNNTVEIKLIPQKEATIQCVTIDSQGVLMASVNNLGRCHVWDAFRENNVLQLKAKTEISASCRQALKCRFSPDSSLLVTTSADQSATIWNTQDFSLHQQLKSTGGQKWVWDAAFTIDSKYLVTGSSDCIARLWNVETGEVVQEYVGHQKAITAIALVDGTKIS